MLSLTAGLIVLAFVIGFAGGYAWRISSITVLSEELSSWGAEGWYQASALCDPNSEPRESYRRYGDKLKWCGEALRRNVKGLV